MPIYEYQCVDCGIKEEIICHHSQADSQFPCNSCGARMIRIVSPQAKTATLWGK